VLFHRKLLVALPSDLSSRYNVGEDTWGGIYIYAQVLKDLALGFRKI
jgi:hypothetical protein